MTLAELPHAGEAKHRPFTHVPPVAGARWILPRLVGEVLRYADSARALLHQTAEQLRSGVLSP